MHYHQPVLLRESITGLEIKEGGTYVDATYGGGGHSRLILEELGANGRLFSFDQDEDAAQNVPQRENFEFIGHNFRFIKRFLRLHGVAEIDGLLADLGVSSHQFDTGSRGFSYRFDGELDMRMNRKDERTAADVLNQYSQEDLQRLFSEYGEVRNAKTLASGIVASRRQKPFQSIRDLTLLLDSVSRGHKPRYFSQVFQALRIEVNDEMGALKELLETAVTLLRAGGRLVIISYHSIEDRLVKNFMRSGRFDGEVQKDFYGNIVRPFDLITRKAIKPSQAEIRQNSRARSARLRIAQKK